MKLTTLLLLVTTLHVSAGGYGQSVTISVKNAPLEKVFNEIEKQTGFNFVYADAHLIRTKPVDLDVSNASLEKVLEMIFKDQPVTYTINKKYVVVKEKRVIIPTLSPPPPIDISGRITNAQGEPLSGASIIIKRTGKGDIADANGKFKINNVNADDVIEISFTGYKTQSIKVGDRANFALILDVAVDELDKVQIQAYGKTTARLRTGNIATVTAEEIERQPVMNPLLALQGKVAGLDVTQTSGYASAPIKVELRGRNAIAPNFTSDPLYIIDGVPLTIMDVGGNSSYKNGSTGFIQIGGGNNGPANGQSPFFSVNPADIESIEVLKDADATAIYGSRGANGVILITTKKGKPGKTKFDLHIQEGITKQTRYWDMLNTQQYLRMRREAFKNDGITKTTGNAYDLLVWDTTRYTDWQKALYGGTGKTTDMQVGLSGGNAQTNFRISAGYNHSTNILTVSGADQRASLSFNLVHRSIDQRFEMSFISGYSYTQSDMISLPGSILYAPNAPSIYDSVGNLNYAGWVPIQNQYPFQSLKQPYTSKTNFLNSNLSFSYQPVKGLKISTSLGYNNAQTNQLSLRPIASQNPANNPTGSALFGVNTNKNIIIEPQLTYDAIIDKGRINILVGGSFQQTNTDGLFTSGSGYTNDALLRTVSNAPIKSASDNSGEYRYAALFGRITYDWRNKYLLNLNVRRDGSSRFGLDNQFGNFGSVGAAWIFTEERLFKKHFRFVSFGKVRGSYGTTGSDAIGDFAYITRWSSSGLNPYSGIQPIAPTQHANPNFHWQVNRKFEGALDLGFFKNRVTLSIAYYRNRCGNQLIPFPTPAFSGFTSVVANSPALIQNDGWEFTASTTIFQSKQFSWSVNFNTAINHNKLVAYPNFSKSPYVGIYAVGSPLNVTYQLHYTGVNPQTGQYSFEDRNHDGVISVSSGVTDDRYIINLTPKFFGGLGMNFNYKNLQLNLAFNVKKQIGVNAIGKGRNPGTIFNQPIDVLNNYWQKPGDMTTTGRFTTTPVATDTYLLLSDAGYTDASFIRLSNLSFSYSLPDTWIKKAKIQGCSIFIHTQNIFTITKYKGLDPETQNFGGMPPAKTIVGGLSFNF